MESPTRLDPAALKRVLAERGRLLASLTRWIGNAQDAEDVLQQAYIKALGRGGTLRREESAVAWFSRLVRNVALDELRRRRASGKAAAEWAADVAASRAARDLRDNACECVAAILEELKPSHGEILRRIDLRDDDPADMARELGTTLNNVRVRLHRARAALRARLLVVCGACAQHGCVPCTCSPRPRMRRETSLSS